MRLICITGDRYHLYERGVFVLSLQSEGGATAAEVEWMRRYATPALFPTVETEETHVED